MVKSKVLKQLRKQVERAEKTPRLLEEVDVPNFNGLELQYQQNSLDEKDLQSCLAAFEENMGEMYRSSSWGLDLDEKRAEFTHRSARFILLKSSSNLAGFVHFRFCFDDDQEPTRAVAYVYEIQVVDEFRRQGLGIKLMKLIEEFAKMVDLPIVMLTVFKSNEPAMNFYREKLGYVIDGNSPSTFDEVADYEILSKSMK